MQNLLQWNKCKLKNCSILLALFFLVACSGGDGRDPVSVTRAVTLNWDANNEEGVNAAGGGYQVYYSEVPGFTPGDINSNGPFDIPYTGVPPTPTSFTVNLSSGRHYFRIIAYSAIPVPNTSAPSSELVVDVPLG